MFENQAIHTEHKDVIHDVAYDYYGQRMATCSSDQYVKVWDQNDGGVWSVTASWKAHSGSVWRLSWAHPEFGQVLATCSFDRTVSVWEETVGEKSSPTMSPVKRWVRRTNLVDSRTSVTDVKFAPKSQGLVLATCSADGIIRIYEAPDIMNLSQWTLSHEIAVKIPLSCLSWNQSMFRLHAPMIAAGSDDSSQSSGGKVFIFEYSENSRRWARTETINSIIEPVHDIAFAPNVGRSYHILAVASKDVQIFNLKPTLEPTSNSRLDIQQVAQFGDHYCTVWRVTWNITGTMLASTGDDGCVRMWKMNYLKSWRCAAVLKAENPQSVQENSIAPSLNLSSLVNATAKYYKRGTISHPTQVLAEVLQQFVYWPDRDEIAKNIPLCFRGKYENVRCVLDCTEIPVATMKCINCCIACYSSYKGMRTVKFLIGITPAGLINFVSKAYSGKASDKQIFNDENVLGLLEPFKDELMVDKGFNIQQECLNYGVRLHIPPFLRSAQHTAKDAVLNESIAKSRIHVERAIQRIKLFGIFQDAIDASVLGLIDYIMKVVCAIVNLSAPILKDKRF